MKFKKKLKVCRYDGIICFEILTSSTKHELNCANYIDGRCDMDDKPCKVIEYERKDK